MAPTDIAYKSSILTIVMADFPEVSRDFPLGNLAPTSYITGDVSQSSLPMQQQPKPASMAQRIAEKNPDFEQGDFYTNPEFRDNVPRGWPRIAAMQKDCPNFNFHRRHSFLTNLTKLFLASKLGCIETRLLELFIEQENNDPEGRRSLLFDPEEFIQSCMGNESADSKANPGTAPIPKPGRETPSIEQQIEKLLEANIPLLMNYNTIVSNEQETQKRPSASKVAHKKYFKLARDSEQLDDKALEFIRYEHDLMTLGRMQKCISCSTVSCLASRGLGSGS
jgi:hypothetical protein